MPNNHADILELSSADRFATDYLLRVIRGLLQKAPVEILCPADMLGNPIVVLRQAYLKLDEDNEVFIDEDGDPHVDGFEDTINLPLVFVEKHRLKRFLLQCGRPTPPDDLGLANFTCTVHLAQDTLKDWPRSYEKVRTLVLSVTHAIHEMLLQSELLIDPLDLPPLEEDENDSSGEWPIDTYLPDTDDAQDEDDDGVTCPI